MHTREKGALGEQLVQKFLESKGYTVIGRNYFYEHCEIDLIVHKERTLYFVEVKSTLNSREQLYENCHTEKVNRLKKAVSGFMMNASKIDIPYYETYLISLALVNINEGTKKAKIQFIENIIE